MLNNTTNKARCAWVTDDPLYIQYHDNEWGVPVYDDSTLFEFLILEGAQAGLNWLTVLKKRDNYRELFDQFDPTKIAQYDTDKIHALMQNPGIIRNRLKIESTITNAKAHLNLIERHGSLSDYLWSFVDWEPIKNRWDNLKQVPTSTPISDALSRDLKKKGFKFVGSTICYAFMQAVGMVNDHTVDCICFQDR